MKYLKTKLEDKLTLELFIQAHTRASKSKAHRSEVLAFNSDKINNLFYIMDVVAAGGYVPSEYRRFPVTDPKPREILALPYVDRIVHQWAVEEFYKPYYFPRFIPDTYACIVGRGTHKAVDRTQAMLKMARVEYGDNFYVLKMDISKYFYSIDQQTLFEIMGRPIVDPRLLDLTHAFIFDGELDVGIPIGNYTSQLFANIYLNELDQFIKHELRVKYYVRYMDDFVLIVPGKATAALLYQAIDEFVSKRLKLCLNPKSQYYPCRRGIDFAGYRIYPDYRLLRNRSKQRLRQIISYYELGAYSDHEFVMHINSWYGHASHADAYRYAHKHLEKYKKLLPAVFKDNDPTDELRSSASLYEREICSI